MKRSDLMGVWKKRLGAWERSGLTIQKFCEGEGITTTTFYKWRRRLRNGERASAPPNDVEFVEIARSDSLELQTASGVVVRLRSDFDALALRRLLDVLDKR